MITNQKYNVLFFLNYTFSGFYYTLLKLFLKENGKTSKNEERN